MAAQSAGPRSHPGVTADLTALDVGPGGRDARNVPPPARVGEFLSNSICAVCHSADKTDAVQGVAARSDGTGVAFELCRTCYQQMLTSERNREQIEAAIFAEFSRPDTGGCFFAPVRVRERRA